MLHSPSVTPAGGATAIFAPATNAVSRVVDCEAGRVQPMAQQAATDQPTARRRIDGAPRSGRPKMLQAPCDGQIGQACAFPVAYSIRGAVPRGVAYRGQARARVGLTQSSACASRSKYCRLNSSSTPSVNISSAIAA